MVVFVERVINELWDNIVGQGQFHDVDWRFGDI